MKIFSKGIFKEGLRQTAPYAILLTVFYGIASMIFILKSLTSYSSSVFDSVSYIGYLPHLSASVFVLMLFSFLYKRKSGDFFGAVDESKKVKVVSLFCASVFQAFIPVVVVTVVSAVIQFFVLPEKLFLGEILSFLLMIFIGCFAFSASAFLGITLMNKWLSGFVFSMVYIGLPLWIASLFYDSGTQISVGGLSIIEADNQMFTLVNVYNYINLKSLPYLIFIGVMALVLGNIVFSKKGYECAGGNTSKNIQILFNVACATCVGLISAYSSYEQTTTTIIYYFAVFVAVICDILCTKSFKARGLLSACITIGVVFLLTSITVFEQNLLTKSYMEIDSFSIVTNNYVESDEINEALATFPFRSFKKKTDRNLEKIRIEDEEITEFLEEVVNNQPARFDADSYDNITLNVTTDSGVKYKGFSIFISNSDYGELYNMICSDTENTEKIYTLEKPSARIRIQNTSLNIDDEKKIYETFYNEYNKLSLEDKKKISQKPMGYNYITMTVYKPWGDDSHLSTYNVTQQHTPETFELLWKFGEFKYTQNVYY